MSILFDPRDARCKSPFGAVTTFAAVDFTFYPRGHAVTGCTLLAHHEFSDRWTETELLPTTDEDGAPAFSGTFFAPSQPELIWYHFRLRWADGGESCYGKDGFQSWDKVTPWQLTVYDGRAKTPDWFGRGVTYQIFPDRFYRARTRSVDGLIGCRTLHERWDETPLCGPNERGDYCEDFFGGDLAGITKRLDYLASLHVTTLYLNPIFEAASNHRYDTADYETVDLLLGDEQDFRTLCTEAEKRGIRVMLDGVFNHTGAKSRYFNADGFYPSPGAAQGPISPYYSWYSFHPFPTDYDAWWGIKNLPAVNERNESYVNYIITGENSIVRRWLRTGASAWRLDVADELPDEFIFAIRAVMQQDFPDAYLLGEVWEDGTTKVAYSKRRRYLLGGGLHGLMNYPFRTALLSYLAGTSGAEDFRDAMETIRENYPSPAFYGAMNFLSTHDTPRLLTLLGCEQPPADRDARAHYRLSRLESRLRQIFAHVANFRERLPLLVGHPCAVPAVADALLHAVRLPVAGNRDSRLIAEPHADKVRLRQIVHPVDLLVLRPVRGQPLLVAPAGNEAQHHQRKRKDKDNVAQRFAGFPQRIAGKQRNQQCHRQEVMLFDARLDGVNVRHFDVFRHEHFVFSHRFLPLCIVWGDRPRLPHCTTAPAACQSNHNSPCAARKCVIK